MVRELSTDAPWNRCFGCSPHNERGIRMTFHETDDGAVESHLEVPEHLVGPPGTVHGGIQAVLLDEVMGTTARMHCAPEVAWAVTAELELRYRRPVPIGVPLVIRGRLSRAEGRDLFVSGEIVGPAGAVLTQAEARFKAVDGTPAPT